MTFQNAGLEVGHGARGVGLHGGLGVLHHHHPVLVIGVGNGKGIFRQVVEERFLGVPIVLHSLVVVHVIAGEIGEDATREFQSADSFLVNGMA